MLIAVAGFASGWMLLWGLAAAIPILLHYLYRRRQTLVRWGAMRLLLQVIEREAKRVRFEQLILLIIRTLLLIVLAIALARPFWTADDAAAGNVPAQPPTNWILAVDVSYSMGYRVGNETRLQAAQRRAVEVIQATSPGDPIALVALGQPAQATVASPSYDRSAVIAEVERLSINDAGFDVSGGLQLIEDIARRIQADPRQGGRVRVLILSDFGADHWQPTIDGPLAKRLRQLGEKLPIEFESLADSLTKNLAVTAVQPSSSRVLAGHTVEVDVSLANYSDASVVDLPVQLAIDDHTVASQRVDIAARGVQTVRFDVAPSTLGLSVLAASIPNDPLPVDNRRLQVIEVREDYDVLFVEQQAGDARILQLGLRPEAKYTAQNAQARRGATVSVLELSTRELSDWQVIVLCDLIQLRSVDFVRLERFVRQGGSLICLWGPRTSAAAWNAQPQISELLGFRLLEPSAEQDWQIDPLDYHSPLVAPFVGFPDAGLLTTPIFRYWRIDPLAADKSAGKSAGDAWLVDLATTSGDPLVVRHRVGAGMVTSFLSAPQTGSSEAHAWNAMAAWPSFVPLIQRLVQTAMEPSVANHSVLAGQPLIGRRPPAMVNSSEMQTVTITKPDGSDAQLAVEDTRADAAVPWTFMQTHQSGLYWARYDSDDRAQPFVVNVDGSESQLQSVRLDQLPRSTAALPLATGMPQTRSQIAQSSPWLARSWLIALGILLLAESWLAWAIGRRSG